MFKALTGVLDSLWNSFQRLFPVYEVLGTEHDESVAG